MRHPHTDPLSDAERHIAGRVTLYLNPDYAGNVLKEALLALPRFLASLPGRSTRLPGLATSWTWRPGWHDGPGLAVRQYAHGGLCGRLRGTLFLGAGRMSREFRVAMAAHRRGVPTAMPVALRVEKVLGPVVRAHYVSETIAGAVDLLELLKDAELAAEADRVPRRRLARAVADAVAAMHDAGIVHADLNVKNLLVRDALDEPQVFVIDFDKACLVEGPALRQRMANLVRLDRSVVKWGAARRAVGLLDRLRVLRHYVARYPRWRGDAGRLVRAYGSRHLRHYLGRRDD